jgi:hypothetical protein
VCGTCNPRDCLQLCTTSGDGVQASSLRLARAPGGVSRRDAVSQPQVVEDLVLGAKVLEFRGNVKHVEAPGVDAGCARRRIYYPPWVQCAPCMTLRCQFIVAQIARAGCWLGSGREHVEGSGIDAGCANCRPALPPTAGAVCPLPNDKL